MRVLIVTSEPLNPQDMLRSTFELSQAEILSSRYDARLLSVKPRTPFPIVLRRSAGRVARRQTPGFPDLIAAATGAMAPPARRHWVEGAEVFEGVAALSGRSFCEDVRSWTGGAMAAFGLYRRRHGVPDLIHAHGRFLYAGAFACVAKRRFGVPYIYSEHSTFYQRDLAPSEARPILENVLRDSAAFCPVSVALSRSVADFLGRPVKEASVLPNAVDLIFETTPPREISRSERFAFVVACAFEPHKGLDVLLHGFARAFGGDANVELRLCGYGSTEEDLRTQSGALGIANQVRFMGKLSPAQVLEQLDDGHALVVPSKHETFGVIVTEALVRGRPVVATRSGGPEEIVTPLDGLIVPPGGAAALANALAAMVRDYQRFDHASIRARALSRYGRRAFLENVGRIYRSALAETPRHASPVQRSAQRLRALP